MKRRKPCRRCGGEKEPGVGRIYCDNCERGYSAVPAETRREMARLYLDEGLSIAQVGRRMYWSYGGVRVALLTEGVKLRRHGGNQKPKLTDEQLDTTLEMYQRGYSRDEIARRLGIASSTVRYRLERAGITVRPRSEVHRLARRAAVAREGDAALGRNQRAVLRVVRDANPEELRSLDIDKALGLGVEPILHTLRKLEALGLVKSIRRGRKVFWRDTELPFMDALEHALTPPVQRRKRDMWLPIGPLREWIHGIIAIERAGAQAAGCDDLAEYGLGAAARRLKLTERRLYALLNEQESVTLSLADELLTRAGDDTRLWDLWPSLESTAEITEFPRRAYAKPREIEAVAA